ncbi:hypothetical protein [Flavobacterium sp. '19STA2R22 D10 B1']|uniref:hypothetical protein n=1 Tax=Flavobacterium aerium TaxID=3037261 RepID=UPI00278BCD09|nr:hypothetical protein [Flavobacterium sp. '19STA2R22 D10 B1']
MLFQIKSYLQFLWHSSNQHGIHSPFVYTLVTRCFYDQTIKPKYSDLKASNSMVLKNIKLLYRITHYFNPKKILLIGSDNSIASTIQLACPDAKIVLLNQTDTPTYFNDTQSNIEIFDFVYIENNLSKDNLLTVVNSLSARIHNDSFIILNPINKFAFQQDIWNSILTIPFVKVSINTYALGLLFFRKEQETEHFTVRV